MNAESEKYRNLLRNAKQPVIDTIPAEVNAIRSALMIPLRESQINLEQQTSSEINVEEPPLISAPPEDERPKKDAEQALRQINEELRQRGLLPPTGNEGPRRGVPDHPY
ncbi:hypothetical protein M9Y10_038052 [Tritrichomonas musculus]|uniref:Uncharacterized protein n=1 Tax=Tritrichomonas musculus TaxID=1915356 RepID=A0ABR2K7B3_9EUKA